MGLFRNPVVFLVASNVMFWGVPLVINQLRTASLDTPFRSDLAGLISEPAPVPVASILGPEPIQPVPQLVADAGSAPLIADRSSAGQSPVDVPAADSAVQDHPTNLFDQLRGADGLGGAVTLASVREPAMPIAARAERLQLQRSPDPLSALPLHWREPLRKQLAPGSTVAEVSTVRLPVKQLRERQEVPVLVNDQGQAEGLVLPRDPQVRAAVEGWAAKQKPAQPGTVHVMVVAAEPLDTVDGTLASSQTSAPTP